MYFFFVKQNTAYEMRISDWSSDVCSSDLHRLDRFRRLDVTCDPDRLTARRHDVFRGFADHQLPAAAEINGGTERRAGPGDGEAQAAPTAGDENSFIREQDCAAH